MKTTEDHKNVIDVLVYNTNQRMNEGLPEMQRASECGLLLFKMFILNALFD
jgi:hypothetical protein